MTRDQILAAMAAMALGAGGAYLASTRDLPEDTPRVARLEVPWERGAPAEGKCAVYVGRYDEKCMLEFEDHGDLAGTVADPKATPTQALAKPSAAVGWSAGYAWVRVQTGGDYRDRLPKCFDVVEKRECAFDSRNPRVTVRVAWEPKLATEADLPCACSTGKECTSLDAPYALNDGGTRGPVPKNATTLRDWAGNGCVPKSCVEVNQTIEELRAGGSSMPAACLK